MTDEHPSVCFADACFSREFTRHEGGTYADDVTLVQGELRVTHQFTELDFATPWVCEGGHEQPEPIGVLDRAVKETG